VMLKNPKAMTIVRTPNMVGCSNFRLGKGGPTKDQAGPGNALRVAANLRGKKTKSRLVGGY
jgi:hypothetical protein